MVEVALSRISCEAMMTMRQFLATGCHALLLMCRSATLLVLLLCSGTWPIAAAQLKHAGTGSFSNEGVSCGLEISGPIETGDAAKVATILKRGVHTVCLDSDGGSYSEGLKIAKEIIERGIPTIIGDGARCYSSCAIIFLAGSLQHEAAREPFRHLHVRGKLGFHAPYLTLPNSSYSKADAEQLFKAALLAIADLLKLDGRGDNLPKGLLAEMLRKGPAELFNVDTIGQIREFKIGLFGTPVLAHDWLDKRPGIACDICTWHRSLTHEDAEYVRRNYTCDRGAVSRGGDTRMATWSASYRQPDGGQTARCVVRRADRSDWPLWIVEAQGKTDEIAELDFWPADTPITAVASLVGGVRKYAPGGRTIHVTPAALPQSPAAPSAGVWMHNGSQMRLAADGAKRRFFYVKPRSG